MVVELEMDNAEYVRTDHHAVLMFDELDGLPLLFEMGAVRLDFDVAGTKTLKQKTTMIDQGILLKENVSVSVSMKECIAESAIEVNRLMSKLNDAGATTCYLTRLLVEWEDGRIDQWNRRVIREVAKELSRVRKSTRHNVLTIVRPTIAETREYGTRYGELTRPTDCPIFLTKGKYVSTCAGTIPGL